MPNKEQRKFNKVIKAKKRRAGKVVKLTIERLQKRSKLKEKKIEFLAEKKEAVKGNVETSQRIKEECKKAGIISHKQKRLNKKLLKNK